MAHPRGDCSSAVCDVAFPWAASTSFDDWTCGPCSWRVGTAAAGIRNVGGIAWSDHPELPGTFFSVIERDLMGPDRPDDNIVMATEEGDFWGFPFCHWCEWHASMQSLRGVGGVGWPCAQSNIAAAALDSCACSEAAATGWLLLCGAAAALLLIPSSSTVFKASQQRTKFDC